MTKKQVKAIIMAALAVMMLTLAGCGSDQVGQKINTNIPEGELDPKVWGKEFPLQYESYMKNAEMAKTDFGGSEKESKFVSEPVIKELFKGYGFSKDYNEDRGHYYALEDLMSSGRLNEKTTGSCMTCKSPMVPKLMKDLGPEYYTKKLTDLVKEQNIHQAIACADCHDTKTMELTVQREPFLKAMKARGIDVAKASKNEMRTYVCAQCHVEYFMDPKSKEVIFPWDKGLEPEQIYEYYNERGNFSDWEHPDSKAPMRKTQHPEFETVSMGTHGTAGVSCSDCHMPYMREDGKKFSSHWWTSPLKTIKESCTTCHSQSEEWLKSRVLNTQQRTFDQQKRAGDVIAEAHQAIKEALAAQGANQDKIKAAQEMVVKAQWHWDWIAAENSRGFHNPQQSLDNLAKAIDYGYQAIELAKQAQNK